MLKLSRSPLTLCTRCFEVLLKKPSTNTIRNEAIKFTGTRSSSSKNSCITQFSPIQPRARINPVAYTLICQQQQFLLKHYSNSSDPSLPPKKKDYSGATPVSWKLLLTVGCIGAGVLMWMQYLKKEKQLRIKNASQKYYGKAKLGGDWELTDHHGNKRSSKDFRGQWILIYFGFTHCPDVCPEEMEKIVNVIKKTDADKNLPKIQPLIITVDPERDTPEALKEYCGEFSPRLLGFTGTVDEIHAATKAFRVYFSAGPKDEDQDYIVDHSIIAYLMNPEGEFVDFFGQDKKAEQIYGLIQQHILKYQQEKKKSSA
ncbi:protein SCO1 homolog, mitochondrial-like [Physella acuta]|uniref:protein SCO1 homolog, mitochondrial-like n=1 Tax=Physella acuta TaxID=109671 RepID=UPI0027DAC27F|nr:protein SCO1 homolog, mitochondrial-like [Physella acuta]